MTLIFVTTTTPHHDVPKQPKIGMLVRFPIAIRLSFAYSEGSLSRERRRRGLC